MSTPGCWSGRRPCLEAIYEESKLHGLLGHPQGHFPVWKAPMRNPSYGMEVYESQLVPGLEATCEESKRVDGTHLDVAMAGLEATYEESKPVPEADAKAGLPLVWKLPMRNPSGQGVRQ